MIITKCQVNHLTDPTGFSMEKTVFSWNVAESKGTRQTAARILVTSGRGTEADTGWADLDCLGAAVPVDLRPRTMYFWTVSVRTDAGEETVSGINRFETGKMEEPWEAKWISCDSREPRHPVFETGIPAFPDAVQARLYICGLGLYEVSFNGKKIGDEYLTPYCNDYHLWSQYQTFDLTEQVREGGGISILLGNGWYKGRFGFSQANESRYGSEWKLIAEIRIEDADGTETVIGTDENWTVRRSTITFSNIYDGEHRDDTLPETASVPALPADPPEGVLTARHSLPVRAHETFSVAEVIHTPAGETVLDIGQNLAGSFRLHIREPAGTEIRLQFGEILQDGNFYNENLRTAKAEYRYVSGGETVLEPRFTFYGFRYVKIEGLQHFQPEDFTAFALYSELSHRGDLHFGHPGIDQLIRNVRWGMKSNFLDVPTDCPQRDERMGWTGDAQVFTETACYLTDPIAFYSKFLYDMGLEQQTDGGRVPDYVPNIDLSANCSSIWGDAVTIMPWTMYLHSGDLTVLRDAYPSMTAWVDYITRLDGNDHGWRRHFSYGDWLSLDAPWDPNGMRGATDEAFLNDVFFRKSAILCAKAAELLGRKEDADRYSALADRILEGIREEYYSPAGRCCIPTQTAELLTLAEELSDPEHAKGGMRILLERSGGTLTTGFAGTPLLCPVLSANGMAEQAFGILLHEQYPGWLYAVNMGATTVWERWNSVLPDGHISSTGMNSLNHYSYGSVAAWLFGSVAGLRPSEKAPGFRKAVIAPMLNWKLRCADLDVDTASGRYRVSWNLPDQDHAEVSITVPFGCNADVTLPLSGKDPFTVGPGTYRYEYGLTAPLRKVLSTRSPLRLLFSDPGAKAILQKLYPQILQLPPSMQDLSLQDLTISYMGKLPAEEMERIDGMLAEL